MLTKFTTDVLIVGGGTGGSTAAIQCARRGVQTIIVSEFSWLGGMLTAAGVAAPDGSELISLQTGIWGEYLKELRSRQKGGLDHSWVSLFTYEPRIGAEIFADWVKDLPNLQWISGQTPVEVLKEGDREVSPKENRITGVRFQDYEIEAKITLDGTELGDLLALGEIPHRWGWELRTEFNEPSAPEAYNELCDRYPVQSPTWVFLLQDYGHKAPEIPAPAVDISQQFSGAWKGYGKQKFLNYGRFPNDLFMLNWPQKGNDYGENLNRLIGSKEEKNEFLKEAKEYSLGFAHFIQTRIDKRYGLAQNAFPSPSDGAFALMPYFRESRRLQGLETIIEADILPMSGGNTAALPRNSQGEVNAIAVGNYANDHHYPGVKFNLQPKSMPWGGRWTGTPFTIPYDTLIPVATDGFIVCEKNISVSHIANGSTRLQPMVMAIGQAAGMAAALCIESNCQPRELPIRDLQEALLTNNHAVIPLLNLPPNHPEWLQWQRYYLDRPEEYSKEGICACSSAFSSEREMGEYFRGTFRKIGENSYRIRLGDRAEKKQIWQLITTRPEVNEKLQHCQNEREISVWGWRNFSGGWFLLEKLVIH
ncbi:FAD-dependent oxidoreductase [Spirulina sp. 06S082]|uniref:FAD-dependent oxidoreductase n=1 Tax=Spirulina sp. 06S082 TaxID=3110248 RepID=UPI002B21B1FC|nr:FAD-dependent oxidoreductase [Spirulina sp. 06S082]MEA5469722.1 FAD-dependent oxidoreductase [Spirulina sp. 06S082]